MMGAHEPMVTVVPSSLHSAAKKNPNKQKYYTVWPENLPCEPVRSPHQHLLTPRYHKFDSTIPPLYLFFFMMCSKGLRKSFWNLKLASSPFSKNFMDSCRRESTAKIATSSLELQPTCTEMEHIWVKSNYLFLLFDRFNKTLFQYLDNQKTEAASMKVHLQGEIKTFSNPLPMGQMTILRFFIPNTNLSLHLLTKRQRLSEPDALGH